MDIPLSVSSVVAPYLGDNGYKFVDVNSVRVLSVSNGSLANYDEAHATAPFGAPSLVVPAEQVLTLAYNKSMLLRIQRTQIQDIPVGQFTKKVALQQADQVFIPAHDAYSIGKVYAARPIGNRIEIALSGATADQIKLGFARMIDKVRTGGGDVNQVIAWVGFEFATLLTNAINFTGSEQGYKEGKKGFLGMFKGAKIVEAPDAYLGEGVYGIAVDKRAVVNVTPKMDPKGDGMVVIDPVPSFSGVELQLRDRSDTFVLNKKVNAVASLEEATSA
jgi:hypothetical protein